MPGNLVLLQRQLAVLRRCAAAGPQPFGALRGGLGVGATSAVRLLRPLLATGLLRRQADGRYGLAPEASALALAILGQPDLEGCERVLADLAAQTGASASYWIIHGRRLLLLGKREVAGGYRYIERFAHRHAPPADHLAGLALLAAQAGAERRRSLRRVPAGGRAILDHPDAEGVVAGTLPWAAGWRAVAVVRRDGVPCGAVGVSRAEEPAAATARRDRRCVAAAARRLGGDPLQGA